MNKKFKCLDILHGVNATSLRKLRNKNDVKL